MNDPGSWVVLGFGVAVFRLWWIATGKQFKAREEPKMKNDYLGDGPYRESTGPASLETRMDCAEHNARALLKEIATLRRFLWRSLVFSTALGLAVGVTVYLSFEDTPAPAAVDEAPLPPPDDLAQTRQSGIDARPMCEAFCGESRLLRIRGEAGYGPGYVTQISLADVECECVP